MEVDNLVRKFLSELGTLKFTPWYRWHPQLAIRYLPVVEEIKDLKRSDLAGQGQTLRVLEVGSGGLGIAPYLKQLVTGIDIKFEPPRYPLLKPINGDAINLEFANDSFDVVVSMDMLEHLSREKREKAVTEMLRVAKKRVIVGVPCGEQAIKHDQKMANVYVSKNASSFRFIDEHLEFGLPEEADILSYIKDGAKKVGKKVKIQIKGNMNIKMREFLMRGWTSKNWLTNIIYRKLFLLLVPMLRMMDGPPYYRKIFFARIEDFK